MIKIKFLPKEDLYPFFGKAINNQNIIYIRDDLPKWIKMSVIVHEIYHLDDLSQNTFYREVKAIMAQLFMSFFGGIGCIVMSLTPSRLKAYYKKYVKK